LLVVNLHHALRAFTIRHYFSPIPEYRIPILYGLIILNYGDKYIVKLRIIKEISIILTHLRSSRIYYEGLFL